MQPRAMGLFRATCPVLYPTGGPHMSKKQAKPLKPKKYSVVPIYQEGPVFKDKNSITETGWVLKMIQQLQPITTHDLWEEVFRTAFNPIHKRSQMVNIIKHLRKDLVIYLRLDPDDLQFYIYVYPQWSRLVRNFIEAERRTEQQIDAKLAANPPPPYDPNPIRYYHQYLDEQERRARLRLAELEGASGTAFIETDSVVDSENEDEGKAQKRKGKSKRPKSPPRGTA
eukprot:Hpha_TRINITY_DN35729_c0_g1::TRINITY_DN35729_c0_g1_i1::g.139940::m.139940